MKHYKKHPRKRPRANARDSRLEGAYDLYLWQTGQFTAEMIQVPLGEAPSA